MNNPINDTYINYSENKINVNITWTKDDIKNLLSEKGIDYSDENVNNVWHSPLLIEELFRNAINSGWNTFNSLIGGQ